MSRICELCKTQNDEDSQFCEKCGNPLVEEEDEKEEEEKDDEDEAEEEEAPKSKPQDLKLLIIPAVLVIIGAIFFLVMNMQSGNRKKEATAVVEKYMTAVKAEKYAEALQGATGIAMSAEYEKSFKEFLRQLTPDMPVNESLHKAMVDLAGIDEGMEKYFQLNRRYPSELKDLVPNYLEKLPDAPGGEYGYEKNLENYTIYVKGKAFAEAGLPENFPAFSKLDRLQTPDRKFVVGEWKVVNYQIIDVQSLSKDKVTIKVKESAKFGPSNVDQENVYTVVFQGGKWQIDPESSSIEMLSFTNAYTQMESMGSAPEKKPEAEGEKKEEGKEEKKEEPKKVIVQMPLGMALLSFSKICENPTNLKTRSQYQYRHCKKGLEKLAAGLLKYSNNHSGKFPNALLWLVPVYIDRIPLNPAAEQDTYSAGYQLDESKERYTIVSQGAYFTSLGINEGFPQYSSKYRLIEKESEIPVEPEITPEPTESPDPDATPTPGEEGIEGSPTPGEETPSESPSPGAEVSPAPEGSPEATPGDEVKKDGEVKEEGKEPAEGKKEDVKPGDKKPEAKPDDKKPEAKPEAKKPEEGKTAEKPADVKKTPEANKTEAKTEKQPEKKAEVKSDKIKIKKAEKKEK